ncbi:MAG: ABC transporter substrate-binding protein [Candidatus Tectomicrobia bacterium]|uniref:ABC transporter substrate-binding protein n=1 Tax=Tectimicrobiota bacterium TaxID=2528274 RepID=A0A932M145_UNCTE|nr:ABC transporter substrate-binding protein [Candidatus Tectomicrobia bacterium]
MRSTAKGRVFGILLAIWVLNLSASQAFGAEKITVGTVGKNQGFLPIWVGQHKGFFKEKGLDVVTAPVLNLDVETKALLAGTFQFSTGAAPGVVLVVEQGQDLKIIAALNNAPGLSLVGRKEYKTLEDLKGTTLGVAGLRGAVTVLMQEILRSKGFESPRDYKMVPMGTTQERMLALETGNVSAVMLLIPTNYMAMDKGYPELVSFHQYVKDYHFAGVNVVGKWARENPGKVVDFLEGVLRANRWIRESRKEAVEIAAREAGVPVEYADRTYDYYITNKIQPLDGTVSEKGVQKAIENLGELGDLKRPYPPASKYIDMSYLREAQKRVFGR